MEINANDDALEERRLSDEAEDDDNTETNEAVKAKIPRDPRKPSQEEIESHNATHVPFRDWCPHCVKGREKDEPHRKLGTAGTEQDEVPTISIDYMYMKTSKENDR